jgi:hypothetical protein
MASAWLTKRPTKRRHTVIVETEPADLLMVRFKLYFNQQRPDPEDPWVFTYLEEHRLEPRRVLHEEHEGVPYKVLHFGQCYLRRHIGALGALYQRGVEYTMLAQHIQELLSTADDPAVHSATVSLDASALSDIAATLAAQLHATARFESTEGQQLRVVIEPTTIREAFLALRSQP